VKKSSLGFIHPFYHIPLPTLGSGYAGLGLAAMPLTQRRYAH